MALMALLALLGKGLMAGAKGAVAAGAKAGAAGGAKAAAAGGGGGLAGAMSKGALMSGKAQAGAQFGQQLAGMMQMPSAGGGGQPQRPPMTMAGSAAQPQPAAYRGMEGTQDLLYRGDRTLNMGGQNMHQEASPPFLGEGATWNLRKNPMSSHQDPGASPEDIRAGMAPKPPATMALPTPTARTPTPAVKRHGRVVAPPKPPTMMETLQNVMIGPGASQLTPSERSMAFKQSLFKSVLSGDPTAGMSTGKDALAMSRYNKRIKAIDRKIQKETDPERRGKLEAQRDDYTMPARTPPDPRMMEQITGTGEHRMEQPKTFDFSDRKWKPSGPPVRKDAPSRDSPESRQLDYQGQAFWDEWLVLDSGMRNNLLSQNPAAKRLMRRKFFNETEKEHDARMAIMRDRQAGDDPDPWRPEGQPTGRRLPR